MKRCQSEKGFSFVFCLSALILFILGHIFELISSSVDGALVGIKVMYAGSNFITPLFLLFIIEYCEVELPLLYWPRR